MEQHEINSSQDQGSRTSFLYDDGQRYTQSDNVNKSTSGDGVYCEADLGQMFLL